MSLTARAYRIVYRAFAYFGLASIFTPLVYGFRFNPHAPPHMAHFCERTPRLTSLAFYQTILPCLRESYQHEQGLRLRDEND